MSKKSRLIASLCIASLCSQDVCAQTKVMGMEDLFHLADRQSVSIQAARSSLAAANEAVKAAKAERLPDVSVSLSASYLGDGTIWDRHFGNAKNIDMPHFGNNFAIEARQTVYAGGAVSSGVRQAELGRRQAELDLQKNVQEVRFMLAGDYLELYRLDNQAKVLRKNIELAGQVIADMKVCHEQGTALKTDITRYELQKDRLGLSLAKVTDARKIINHRLVTTLHLPAGTEITPDTTLLQRQVAALNERDWQQTAAANNVDLMQAETAIRQGEQKVKLERSELLPHVSIIAADHLDGPVTIEVPVLDNNFNYWYVGIGVSYNISSLFKNNKKLKRAKQDLRTAQERRRLAQEQVENAVQAAYTDFMTAFTELDVQRNNVRLADENYAVTDNRYRNGMALLTDMLDAGNAKLDADLGLANAHVGVIYNYYKLKYITHTL